MYVEFTGCSGSGKSTISERVITLLLRRGHRVLSVHAAHFSALGPRFQGVRHATLQNLLLDAHGIWRPAISAESRRFSELATELLHRHSNSLLRQLNLRRSIKRKLGIHALMASQPDKTTFRLVDEGIVHSAHNLLVHAESVPNEDEIRAFAERVPLPRVIVWSRAPVDRVVERALRRQDHRWRGLTEAELRRYIEHGCWVFEKVMANSRISERTILLDSGADRPDHLDRLAAETVERICGWNGHA